MRMFIVLSLFLSTLAQAKTITIAVIDTGIDKALPNLCRMGHKSFVKELPDPLSDEHGHGTHVAGLINQNAGEGNFCLVAIKYYSDKQSGMQNLAAMRSAIQYAINIKATYVNISGGGPESNDKERALIIKGLNKGIQFIVAAGNEGDNLDKKCNYFPACYDARLVVVGNLEITKDYRNMSNDWKFTAMLSDMGNKLDTVETMRAPSSNYGAYVKRWEIGTNCESTLPGGKTGHMSGTSQATGVATGKLVKERLARH